MTGVLALSQGDIATIVVVVVVALFAILLVGSFVRARRSEAALAAAAEEAPEAAPAPPPERAPRAPRAVTRREFFRRSLVGSLGIFAAQFGGASLAFLWPNLKGGFGSTISAGLISDIKNQIQQTNQPFYVGVGRFYIVSYNGTGKDEATGTDYETDGVIQEGLMPLYQRCVHLGCRVPFCQQSQWFECPCHGSKYNKAGEYQLGPAPTGMDRFKISIDDSGNVMVDTSTIVQGPPRGTDTTHQSPQGPFCVAPG